MEREDALKNIQNRYQSLSKGHKKLADYVLTNYDKVVFMTVNELSTVVGISESTVVRFAHSSIFSKKFTVFDKKSIDDTSEI